MEETIIVGVKFRDTGKTYFFSPKDILLREGDGVICETARGIEFGRVTMSNRPMNASELVAPLKEILRKATPADEARMEDNLAQRDILLSVAAEKAEARGLEMKIVEAEYTFDRQKAIIYFTADGRVDFRELVKDLASAFHSRIELKQIYERDEIKLQGALAACGRPCCCTTFLHDFDKVTIKMAKIQGLSLNPQKISGCCGKLMCCLKYENDFYQEMYGKMPKNNSLAKTPDGDGQVISNNIIKQEVTVKVTLADGSIDVRTYPLSAIVAKVKQNEKEITDEEEVPTEPKKPPQKQPQKKEEPTDENGNAPKKKKKKKGNNPNDKGEKGGKPPKKPQDKPIGKPNDKPQGDN